MPKWTMATEEDVRQICRGLPGVSERPSWGQPAWFGKTLMARIWEVGVLTVKTGYRTKRVYGLVLLPSDGGANQG